MSADTPYFDAWRGRLELALEARGARTELARWLAGGDESKLARWKVALAKVINQGMQPEAEFLLSVNAWLAEREKPAPPAKGGRRTIRLGKAT